MIAKKPELVSELKSLLKEECAMYERYQELLAKERELLRVLKNPQQTDVFMLLTAERDILSQHMQQSHLKRMELVKIFKEPRGTRFSVVLNRNFHAAEKAELLPLVERLRDLIVKTQKGGAEFGQVLAYSLNLVGGVVSMLMSATQSVVRCYSRGGKLKESYHDNAGRNQRELKRA